MRLFGLIGKTLKHSFSKDYFTQKFSDLAIMDCRYENFELPSIDRLPALLSAHPQLEGLNVTIPYKEEVLQFLDTQNDVVREIGACNCIKITGGKLHGFNTDVVGFKHSLQRHLRPFHKRALVLGTGGAAKAVWYVLKHMGIEFTSVSRHEILNGFTYGELDESIIHRHLLIINTTPVGMYPHIGDAPPIPYQFLTHHHLLYDLIYNPPKTRFLQIAHDMGAATCNGQEMLELQAEEAWRIWNTPL